MRPLYRTLVASVAEDRSILTLTDHVFPVSSLAFGSDPDGSPLLAAGAEKIHLWDPVNGVRAGEPLVSPLGKIESITFNSGLGGRMMLAARSPRGAMALWNNVPYDINGKNIAVYRQVTSVAFGLGPDQEELLAASSVTDGNGKVDVWDPVVGRIVTSYDSAASSVIIGSGPDGRLLAAGWGCRQIWDVLTQAPLYDLPAGSLEYYPRAFHVGPDRHLLLISGNHRRTLVSDVNTGVTLTEERTGPRHVALGNGHDHHLLLASAYRDECSVRLRDTVSGRHEKLTGHTQRVEAVAFGTGPDGQPLLASGARDHTVRIWGLFREGVEEPPADHRSQAWVTGRPSFPEGRFLEGTGSNGQKARLWERTSTTRRTDRTFRWGYDDTVVFAEREGGRLLAAGSDDHRAWVWDPLTGEAITGPLPSTTVDGSGRPVAFISCPDGPLLLAVGGTDGTVRIYDPLSGDERGESLRISNSGEASALAFGSSDGQLLLAVGYSNTDLLDSLPTTIMVWDVETRQPIVNSAVDRVPSLQAGQRTSTTNRSCTRGLLREQPMSLALELPRTAVDGYLRPVSVPTAKVKPPAEPLRGHSDHVLSVAFGTEPDGRLLLASGSTDCTVRLWDPLKGEAIGEPLTGHRGWVGPVAFSSHPESGRLILISGGGDHVIRLWDLTNRECRLELRRRSPVASIRAAGRVLAITDHEGASMIELDEQFSW